MMLNNASFMLEDSLGMLFPGSALAKGTAVSENSGHQGISRRRGKVKVIKKKQKRKEKWVHITNLVRNNYLNPVLPNTFQGRSVKENLSIFHEPKNS